MLSSGAEKAFGPVHLAQEGEVPDPDSVLLLQSLSSVASAAARASGQVRWQGNTALCCHQHNPASGALLPGLGRC